MHKQQEFQQRFHKLQQKFIHDIAVNTAKMQLLLEQLHHEGNPAALQQLMLLAHQYNGSGQTFGFPHISQAGKMLEQELKRVTPETLATDLPQIEQHCQAFFSTLEMAQAQDIPELAITDEIPGEQPLAPLAIVIADDDALAVQFLSHKLKEKGHRVRVAATGQQALELVAKQSPDVVLLDGMLPDMDGFSVLQTLKSGAKTKQIPVIMLTARRQEKNIKAGMGLGAADYIVKPFKTDELLQRIVTVTGRPVKNDNKTADIAGNSKTVCILAEESGQAQAIADQLRHFGYHVLLADSVAAFAQNLRDAKPYAMIVFSDLSGAERDALLPLCAPRTVPGIAAGTMPQLIVSSRNDFDARLAAVKLGARGYFTESTDVLRIIDKIEQLANKYTPAPAYHILIVDDDRTLVAAYSNALEEAGMKITTVSDPKDALEVISGQAVDLILIDFTMPHCNGDELAAIIRQHDRYVSLPIIFMSAQEDIETLLMNTGLGIDDFLIKPIHAQQLVSVVRNRAQRAGELQALMARDSFTGLLNHANFLEMLNVELSQVLRNKTPAAYASIDIDHFKQVNDTYGHAAGDQVIRSLARLLQQRLRRTDIIGRCGGEEFGIIMPDCGLADAQTVVESLRVKFAESSYHVAGHDINVTFSAGVTALDRFANVDELINATDDALYQAKAAGRNQVVVLP